MAVFPQEKVVCDNSGKLVNFLAPPPPHTPFYETLDGNFKENSTKFAKCQNNKRHIETHFVLHELH
jgi:hypothetical protein